MAKKVKQKTKKAVAKRFRRTAKGKIKRASTGRGHLLGHKSRKRKRQLRGNRLVAAADEARVGELLPK